ncbi:MAG TPA: nucleotide sugar dehydrogenase [Actinomycetota bacterium]|nr:nucleotide sugar dehydrogenase [Actinomycetota bacterium]
MRNTAALRRRILARTARVGIVGQGYVGVSLACACADAGFPVVGVDVDRERIEDLRAGVCSVPGVDEALFRDGIASGRITFTTDPDAVGEAEIVLICVPTPLRDQAPDLSYIVDACREVARVLRPGRLVVLESTTYPGTTEEMARPVLEGSGLVAGRDFLLAYSPERIDPGNPEYGLRNTPKVVGGMTPEATGLAALFYGQFVQKVVSVSSCRAAELAKLLENTFRHVNIALVNELAMLCHEMGIDVWEVVEAAATKPFGFMSFQPGPGVGGHCIPLDPGYLAWQVRRDVGHQFRILEQAQDVNARVPGYVASRIGEALNERGRALKGSRILVLGVAYKPDVGDVRESPALEVMRHLHRRGAQVAFHDPYVELVSVNGTRQRRIALTSRAVETADCVALLTPHGAYDLEWVAERARLVFDARNAYGQDRRPNVVRL